MITCLNQGFVDLISVMGDDTAIAQAARVSTGSAGDDRDLIRYLYRHRHTTPFEMVEFKFHCKMPIFVARQWIRHRTANVNEKSGRYSILRDEFYIPDADNLRKQSTTNKQGGGEVMHEDVAHQLADCMRDSCKEAYGLYEGYLGAGMSMEQARITLPLNLYTEWYWKIDLHNLLHFLGLRCDSHAQWEIRVFADAMLALISPLVPLAVEAWNDYHPMRGAILLTRLEVEALRDHKPLASTNKREQDEWRMKAERLGL